MKWICIVLCLVVMASEASAFGGRLRARLHRTTCCR